ncbi:hypothetical protein V6Z11_D01G149000 [Gossypium hirsutum]
MPIRHRFGATESGLKRCRFIYWIKATENPKHTLTSFTTAFRKKEKPSAAFCSSPNSRSTPIATEQTMIRLIGKAWRRRVWTWRGGATSAGIWFGYGARAESC